MTRDRADISNRTGLNDAAVKVLEDVQQQSDAPIIRALNDIITQQNADLEKHLLHLIAVYLYYDLSGKTPFRTVTGEPVHTVDLSYRQDVSVSCTMKMDARDIVSSMILDALRDLSQKIQEGEKP